MPMIRSYAGCGDVFGSSKISGLIVTVLDSENSRNMNSRLSPTLPVTKVLFDVCHLWGAIYFLYGMDYLIPLHTKARSPLDLLSSNMQYTHRCDRLLLLNWGIATTQVMDPQPTMVPFLGSMALLSWPFTRPMTFPLWSTTLIGLGIVLSQFFGLIWLYC